MVDKRTPKEAQTEAHAFAGAIKEHGSEMDAVTRLKYRMKQLAAEAEAEQSHAQSVTDKELRRRALANLQAKDNSR